MQSLVVFGAQSAPLAVAPPVRDSVVIDGVRLPCGVVPVSRPDFDPHAPEHRDAVLLRVTAFSCNYRDRAFCYAMQNVRGNRFTALGSEFVGRVLAVGAGVQGLHPGDRVIPDQHYEGTAERVGGVRPGVVSNQASRGYHVRPAAKLRRAPDAMSDEVAAGFALNAQTAYSMVRRTAPQPGAPVLVMSAGSNTSLALIGALRRTGARVFATTTTRRVADRVADYGVEEVIVGERGAGPGAGAALAAAAARVGGFAHAFDPFFDLNAVAAAAVLRPFGSYVFCGLLGQNPYQIQAAGLGDSSPATQLMLTAMTKNLSLVGNCIGVHADLDAAVEDYVAGRLPVMTDSCFGEGAVGPFLDRTFNSSDRLGKVVYQYA